MTLPSTMQAAVLTAHGGLDKIDIRHDWPVPIANDREIVIRVGAAGINNTDINTRIGWYSKSVTSDTAGAVEGGIKETSSGDASWSGIPLTFPRIQGADICGEVVATGAGVDRSRRGERVLVRALQPLDTNSHGLACITIGSEADGGFAEYVVVKSNMAVAIKSSLSDSDLASFPCAYSTAENMLQRINLSAGERVLITGASGGVGSAAVQLAKRRGCEVIASASPAKHQFLNDLNSDRVIDRTKNLHEFIEPNSIDVVVDLVGGSQFPALLDSLKRGGRYITAGAIGGPICELDLRTVYLNDLTLAGSTYQSMDIFLSLVKYIEQGEIVPVVSKTYPLSEIAQAQSDFISKIYPGKLTLIPDALFATSHSTGEKK